jgi:hypothetical protein
MSHRNRLASEQRSCTMTSMSNPNVTLTVSKAQAEQIIALADEANATTKNHAIAYLLSGKVEDAQRVAAHSDDLVKLRATFARALRLS